MNITFFHPQKGIFKKMTLRSLTEKITEGKYSNAIEKYRNWLANGHQLPRPAYVDKVPLFCLNELDEQQKLIEYNGLIHLFIRGLHDSAEKAELTARVNASPRTLLSYSGLSGSSLHWVCRYSLPGGKAGEILLPHDEALALKFHAHAYDDAQKYYQKWLNRPALISEYKLEEWHRFASDANLYFCPKAEIVQMEQPTKMPGDAPTYVETLEANADPIQSLRPGDHRDNIVRRLFDNCYRETLEEIDCPPRDADLHPFLCPLARRCYQSKVPEADCVRWTMTYMVLYTQKDTVSTIVHNVYATEKGGFGLRPCIGKEQKMAWQLKDFVSRNYELRFNELKQCAEYVDKTTHNHSFQTVDTRIINSICFSAHEAGISVWDKDVRRLVESDFVRNFNPLSDYVMFTPEWDQHDHIRDLARRVPTSHPAWPDMFFRWFLSMVAHWLGMDPVHANSVTPQLLGGPGERKSTFCRKILPPELSDYYTDHLNLTSLKSATRMLSRFGLINIDEFDQIAASKQAFLKNFLQMPDVKDSAPYQSQVKTFQRYASFIATSNMRDVLTDPTGSRRYLCVEVTGQIDTSPIDYPQLYAQAKHLLLHRNERYWYTKEEEAIISEHNKRFEREPREDQLFCALFRAPLPGEKCEELRPAEILAEIARHFKVEFGKKTADGFGRHLTKMGIPSFHRRTGSVYQVVRIKQGK